MLKSYRVEMLLITLYREQYRSTLKVEIRLIVLWKVKSRPKQNINYALLLFTIRNYFFSVVVCFLRDHFMTYCEPTRINIRVAGKRCVCVCLLIPIPYMNTVHTLVCGCVWVLVGLNVCMCVLLCVCVCV